MNFSSRLGTAALSALLSSSVTLAATRDVPARPNPPLPQRDTRAVDVVIALDTSGSMEELLDATRARLWDIVNEFARMEPTPELRVGLISYGTLRSSEQDGWVLLDSDLTDDLDAIYADLMSLRASGSDELVGRALDVAVREMSWSPDWDGLRLVFFAGNESVDQGAEAYDFRRIARDADDRDILVNALYAGTREQGALEGWPELARAGRGNFSAIDTADALVQIATPQDEPLLELNARLNGTYLPYGPRGEDGLANQTAQDNNASRLGVQSCSSRIVAKGTSLYTNASWDLVDAVLREDFELDSLPPEDLPEKMRPMTAGERRSYVQEMRAAREAIQAQIEALSREREAFLRAARQRKRDAAGLDDAMLDAIRVQARAKGFTCAGC